MTPTWTDVTLFPIILSKLLGKERDSVKISTRGQYGVRAMSVLADRYGEGPIPNRDIAEAQGLSQSYLEQLLAPLRRAGLVRSVRGPEGGYYLSRPPEEITVGDVLRVLEGSLSPVECVEDHTKVCARADICPARRVWMLVRDSVNHVVNSINLADLISPDNLEMTSFDIFCEGDETREATKN
ncbi:MAG: RrF2 family transcriptional regulator [Bacillota bacterium]